MRNFFENKVAFGATVLAFALASGTNALSRASVNPFGTTSDTIAIIPTFPPCPSCEPPEKPPPPDGDRQLVAEAPQIIPTFPPCPSCEPPEKPPPPDGRA